MSIFSVERSSVERFTRTGSQFYPNTNPSRIFYVSSNVPDKNELFYVLQCFQKDEIHNLHVTYFT